MQRPPWLVELAQRGTVAASRIRSRHDQTILETLVGLGLLGTEASTYQRRVVVRDTHQFHLWLEAHYPADLPTMATLAPRAANILEFQDSKARRGAHEVQPIILKWFDRETSSIYGDLTRQYGMVGVLSNRLARMTFPATWHLLTVENWESFAVLAYDAPSTPIIIIYLSGHVPDVTLRALTALDPPPVRVLHFGDYDWTGLHIFRRVQAVLPHTQLYVPDNLQTFFTAYGNRELLEAQVALDERSIEDADMRYVSSLIAQYNAGLEQEIVPAPREDDFGSLYVS